MLDLEIDIKTKPLALVKTKKLVKPVELMTIREYVEHLKFMESHELPELEESQKVVVKMLSKNCSKVMIGGKYRYADESAVEIEFQVPAEFKRFNSDLLITYLSDDGKRKTINAYNLFEQSLDTKKYNRVKFDPSHVGDYATTKNLFKGFPIAKDKARVKTINATNTENYTDFIKYVNKYFKHCSRLIEHIHDNLCDGDNLAFSYTLAWLSDIINQPEVNPHFALVLRSAEKGTGKSTLAEIMQAIIGNRHYFQTNDESRLNGRFNAHLQTKLLVVGEEMTWGGNKKTESAIKDLITSSHMAVELKGIDAMMERKYFRLMLLTNSDWAVNASDDERRFLMLDVAAHQAQNKEYFEPLYSDLGDGYCEYMLNDFFHLLCSINTSSMDMTKPPETKGLRVQKLASLTPMQQWWLSCIEDETMTIYEGKFTKDFPSNTLLSFYNDVPKQDVFESYLSWLDKFKPNQSERITGQRQFGLAFKKLVGDQYIITQNIKINSTGKNAYRFKAQKEMIEHFLNNM